MENLEIIDFNFTVVNKIQDYQYYISCDATSENDIPILYTVVSKFYSGPKIIYEYLIKMENAKI
jgi:hypothetical protein